MSASTGSPAKPASGAPSSRRARRQRQVDAITLIKSGPPPRGLRAPRSAGDGPASRRNWGQVLDAVLDAAIVATVRVRVAQGAADRFEQGLARQTREVGPLYHFSRRFRIRDVLIQ